LDALDAARFRTGPGSIQVDFLPDVSELTPAEHLKTGFKFAGGRPAELSSSCNREPVLRHFH
jgi:hypothetical protein